MQLSHVLDIIEGLLNAAEHPDIVSVRRYGTGTEPWGPTVERSKAKTVTGVKVTYRSTATASLWGAVWPEQKAVQAPAEPLPPKRRANRLPIFVGQLLDVARPAQFTSWQLVALKGIGPEADQGVLPLGLSLACADGTTVLLRCTATGVTEGTEAVEEPFPGYRIPEGVKQWHLKANARSAAPA